jgi:tetratricopeptide (TPR) repeat protein
MNPGEFLMKPLVITLLAITLLANSAVFAAAGSELSTAIALVKKGQYKKAIPLLRKEVELSPDSPEANYYLGLALNRTAPGKEAESYLKRSLMENPDNPALNYELGLHYFDKDVSDEAGDYFEQVILSAPESELALKAREFLQKIEESKQEKDWELSIFAGGQYDSNVILNGSSMPLPAGYSKKSDWSGIVNLKGTLTPIKTANLDAAISYSFYQSLHSSLKNFDITQHLVEVSARHDFSSALQYKFAYSFEALLLDGNEYDFAQSLAPSLILKSGLGTTTIDYRYKNIAYRKSQLFSTNSDRTGDNHLAGITHMCSLTESVAALALYTYDIESTRKSEWDYHGNRVLAGLRAVLPFGLVGISGEAYWKNYGAVDPAFLDTRRDTQYTASLSLTSTFSPRYNLTLSEVYSYNVSNIPEFEYKRSITSLLFNARF